jgi:hypothetical protein
MGAATVGCAASQASAIVAIATPCASAGVAVSLGHDDRRLREHARVRLTIAGKGVEANHPGPLSVLAVRTTSGLLVKFVRAAVSTPRSLPRPSRAAPATSAETGFVVFWFWRWCGRVHQYQSGYLLG